MAVLIALCFVVRAVAEPSSPSAPKLSLAAPPSTWVGLSLSFINSPVQGIQGTFVVLDGTANFVKTLGSVFMPGPLTYMMVQSGAFACESTDSAWITTYDGGGGASTLWHVAMNGTIYSSTTIYNYGITALAVDSVARLLYVAGRPSDGMSVGMQAVRSYPLDDAQGSPGFTVAVNMSEYMSAFEYAMAGGMAVDVINGLLYMQTSTSYMWPVIGPSQLYSIDMKAGKVMQTTAQPQTLGALWMQPAAEASTQQLFGFYLNYSQPQNGAYPDPANFTVGSLDPATGLYAPTIAPSPVVQDLLGVGYMGSVSSLPSGLLSDGNTMAAVLGTTDRVGYWVLGFNATGDDGRQVDTFYMRRSPSRPLYAICSVAS